MLCVTRLHRDVLMYTCSLLDVISIAKFAQTNSRVWKLLRNHPRIVAIRSVYSDKEKEPIDVLLIAIEESETELVVLLWARMKAMYAAYELGERRSLSLHRHRFELRLPMSRSTREIHAAQKRRSDLDAAARKCAMMGNVELLKMFEGCTRLEKNGWVTALQYGQRGVVDFYLDQPNFRCYRPIVPYLAAQSGNLQFFDEVVKAVGARCSVATALLGGCFGGQHDFIEEMIRRGAGNVASSKAVQQSVHGKNYGTTKWLLTKHGAPWQAALDWFAALGVLEMVCWCIENVPDIVTIDLDKTIGRARARMGGSDKELKQQRKDVARYLKSVRRKARQ